MSLALEQAYAPCTLRLWLPDGVVDVQPVHRVVSAAPPFGVPLSVIGLWNPGGEPTTPEANSAASRRPAPSRGRGVWQWRAAALGPGLAWVEAALALSSVAIEEAQRWAMHYQQRAFLRWQRDGVVVHDSSTLATVTRWEVRVDAAPSHTCVMQLEGPCAPPAAETGEASINVQHRWREERLVRLDTFGACTQCTYPFRSGPTAFREWSTPSRWQPTAVEVLSD